jgi:hypothetical protein
MLADQQSRIRRICTPTHRLVEPFLIFKLRHERRNRFLNTLFGRIRDCISRVLRMRPWYRNALWCFCAVRLMRFEARKARELVADFDDAVLIGLKKEADIAIVDYGSVFVASGFFWCELYMCIYPGLDQCQWQCGGYRKEWVPWKHTARANLRVRNSRLQLLRRFYRHNTLFHQQSRHQYTLLPREEVA